LPRVVRTLWFEDVGLLNEPVFDTPLGRLTIRQTIALMAFALLAWTTTLFFEDLIFKVVVGGAVFLFGAVLFMHRVKTVPPERVVLLALGLGRKCPRKPMEARKAVRKGLMGAPAPAKTVRVSAELDAPVKIVGVLRDPSTGRLLPERSFEVCVDGGPYSAGVTDEQGFFTVFFAPQRYGAYRVEVRPEGYAGPAQTLEVLVQPKGGVRAV
jgi:hypothetical protein